MFKLLKYIKKRERLLILVSIVFIVIQVFLDLRLPGYMAEITRALQTEGSTIDIILIAGFKMLGCAFGSMVSALIVIYFVSNVAAHLARQVRQAMFYRTMDFSMSEINNFSTASLITRSTNDVSQVQQIASMGLQMMIKAPLTAVWAILKILGKGWQWSAVTAAAVVILLSMMTVIIIYALPRFRQIQKLTDNINRLTRENLTGIRVIRAYNAEKYQEEKFARGNDALTRNSMSINRVMVIVQSTMGFVMSSLTMVIYLVGAYMIDGAQEAERLGLFSNMVVFSSYAMQIMGAFIMLSVIFIMYPRASVAAGRINEVLNTKPSILSGKTENSLPSMKGEVVFSGVGFKYPDAEEYVLKDISFRAGQGETVAFIGSTGSGKSTLINLIPRFYEATEGVILIDGVNVKDYTSFALNNKLGYVSQKAVLFSGTVRSNIDYGENGKEPPSDSQIQRAVEIAQGRDFVEKMEGAYDAHIARGGTNLSGGQKQRLSIARAICREPEIYIFDDSYSALDYQTDRRLRDELGREVKDATKLIVAQRIGTIKHADRIVVLDKGRTVGIGTHEELMETCETYQQIAYSQLSKEELAHG